MEQTITNTSHSVQNLIVVSYDPHGYENEIETYLFREDQVDKSKICSLREYYELYYEDACIDESISTISFQEWVTQKGIFCMKATQYRVEPFKKGKAKDYDATCLDN